MIGKINWMHIQIVGIYKEIDCNFLLGGPIVKKGSNWMYV
jgi:hypothetical protein